MKREFIKIASSLSFLKLEQSKASHMKTIIKNAKTHTNIKFMTAMFLLFFANGIVT